MHFSISTHVIRNTCMQQPLASKIEDATIFLEHEVLL